MRVVVVVFAALLTVALAAFGVVAAHKTPASLVAFAQHLLSPAQATSAPVNQATAAAPPQVIKVSETSATAQRPASSPQPAGLVVAQGSTAASSQPAPARAW